MSKKEEIYRKQLLVIIHTHPFYKHAKQNDAWEEFLSAWDVKSCAQLKVKELINLIAVMDGKDNPKSSTAEFATQSQIYAIKSLWQRVANDKSDRALLFFIKRITKKFIPKNRVYKKERGLKDTYSFKKDGE